MQNNETKNEALIGESDSTAGLDGAFQREKRYAVLKWKDVTAALTLAELDDLRHIMWKTHDYREQHGKTRYVDCVVVEKDWPEYEPTWRAIEERMTTANGQIEPLPTDNQEKKL